MRLFPVSIERIIAENRISDAAFRKSWSFRDYTFRYILILVIIAIVAVFGSDNRVLKLPLWIYGAGCIMTIIVCTVLEILDRKEAADKEDELIKYILNDNIVEDEVYSNSEIKDILLSKEMRNS